MKDDDPTTVRVYRQLELLPYVGPAAERSIKAKTSHVPDLADAIRPTHISHLAIGTSNFAAVADWWQTVLNLEPSLDAEGMRFMTFDQEHHKIVVFEFDGLTRRAGGPLEQGGMHHIAFSYASFGDLAATYRRLKEAGITPYRGINHGTSYAFDYYDPDFNCCELQCSCFPSAIGETGETGEDGETGERPRMNDWLATGAFNRNPIGVLFDVEEAIAAFEAGVDVREILSPYRMRIGDHSPDELAAGVMDPEKRNR